MKKLGMELVKYNGFKEKFIQKSYGNSARAGIVAALPVIKNKH